MKKIYLICGYRGTGKDTLCNQLLNGNFNWTIYRAPNSTENFPSIPVRGVRVAFADELKREVAQRLTLSPEYINENKNTVVDGKTIRQHLIDRGLEVRQTDRDYWCRRALDSVDSMDSIIITDWRFLNEKVYCDRRFQTVTIRVYRPEVPIPPENEESERSLDRETTDFLLLYSPKGSSKELFEKAVAEFPQYRNYLKDSP